MEEQIQNTFITMDGEENVKGSIKVIKDVPIFNLVFRKYSENWKEEIAYPLVVLLSILV